MEDKFGPHEIQRRSKWRLDPISDGCQRWIGVGVYMDAYTKSPSWRQVYARDVQTKSPENNENSNRRPGANALERIWKKLLKDTSRVFERKPLSLRPYIRELECKFGAHMRSRGALNGDWIEARMDAKGGSGSESIWMPLRGRRGGVSASRLAQTAPSARLILAPLPSGRATPAHPSGSLLRQRDRQRKIQSLRLKERKFQG